MIRIGDLVVCSSKAYRAQAGLGLDVGMYMLDRRRDGLVLFPDIERSAWILKTALLAVAADDPRVRPPPPWLEQVHRVMRMLDASDIEIERDDDGRLEARIGCGGIDVELLHALEAHLGPAARTLKLRPGSMSRILIQFLPETS